MIRFFLDTDDDFDVLHGLDITEEIISWTTDRAAHRISRLETEGLLRATLRRGRALASWWRVGRLIEARVGDIVWFRGFLLDAAGGPNGQTTIRALTWLQHLRWRGRNPDVLGRSVIEAIRLVVNEAANGFPGPARPSAALVERIFGGTRPRRLFWRGTDRPLFWRSQAGPLYWRAGPVGPAVAYHYGFVGQTDVIGEFLLVGPPQPAVEGESAAVVDRLTAVEYRIEDYEFGFYEDELAVLAGGERGWLYSGGHPDIECVGRNNSARPRTRPMMVFQRDYGRHAFAWKVAEDAIGQVIGRQPDVQISDGVVYRQERVHASAGVSSWTVALRDRGRPAEAIGDMVAIWPMTAGVSVKASALAGDLLIEVFNDTGDQVTLPFIEVSGSSRVYQGGLYDSRPTGRYGGASVELRGVFGGAAGLAEALDYWSTVLSGGGAELSSVTLDGRRFEGAWAGQIGAQLVTDALSRGGVVGGPTVYWIIGARARGDASRIEATYDLMRYGRA